MLRLQRLDVPAQLLGHGRRLAVPESEGLRPTPDRVRETLFNWLQPYIAGAHCLDLFAGTGALCLEALSRGAAHVTFVERDARAVQALRDNVETLGVAASTRVVRGDVARELRALPDGDARFSLVFLDPPYDTDSAATLETLGGGALTTPDALVVVQHLTKRPPPAVAGRLAAFRTRRFGETTLTFFRAGAYDAPSPSPAEREV